MYFVPIFTIAYIILNTILCIVGYDYNASFYLLILYITYIVLLHKKKIFKKSLEKLEKKEPDIAIFYGIIHCVSFMILMFFVLFKIVFSTIEWAIN